MAKVATKENEAWDRASSAVRESASSLREMTTHGEIYAWAKGNELATTTLFPKVKSELRKQLHIDYEGLREKVTIERYCALAAAAAEQSVTVELCAAGDVEVMSYAVCNTEGGDPWYGTFFDKDPVTDQNSADVAAAKKAIYLAGKARHDAGLEVLTLHLIVSNHHVDLDMVRIDAVKSRVHVQLDIVDGDNPALELCRTPGWRSWREVSLTDLLRGDGDQ